MDTDPRTILVEIRSLDIDYEPLALKFFLEHCTGSQNRVERMVVSTDQKYVIVSFRDEIGM